VAGKKKQGELVSSTTMGTLAATAAAEEPKKEGEEEEEKALKPIRDSCGDDAANAEESNNDDVGADEAAPVVGWLPLVGDGAALRLRFTACAELAAFGGEPGLLRAYLRLAEAKTNLGGCRSQSKVDQTAVNGGEAQAPVEVNTTSAAAAANGGEAWPSSTEAAAAAAVAAVEVPTTKEGVEAPPECRNTAAVNPATLCCLQRCGSEQMAPCSREFLRLYLHLRLSTVP